MNKKQGNPKSGRRRSINAVVDNIAFAFSGLAAVWLAWLVLSEGFVWGWTVILFFVLFWLVLAYLVLPRLHRILTSIYVPDYFIGRARTSDGLLGDPINLAIVGSEAQLHEAMTRSGWIRADPVTFASSWRIVTSTIFRRSYDEAPVSPLLLFGHQQDLAYQQEVAGNPAKRHHVRFWRCPDGWLLPGGHGADWLAAGTFDRAVGFSLFTLQITHKIDADTDTERDHIVETLKSGGPGIEVRVIEDFATGYHSRNGGGDSIETDGNLPVVDVGPVTIAADGNPLGPDLAARRAALARRRPASTALGVVLMAIRVVVGLVTVAMIVTQWPVLLDDAGVSLTTADQQILTVVRIIVIVVGAVGVAAYLLLAIGVFRGSNWARIASMAYSGLLVAIAAFAFFSGESTTLTTNVFGLPLDILVLLALSAHKSRVWARRGEEPALKAGGI
ncbi:LssY C-terminal domain-containing protein [Arthrobacter sp.]|uniref:LssY C-terminal domain-containing protein n=1 Tax=Arthrobacter sp. TaxID=1667 RepID=UPI0026DFE8B2|nr:LssY C-terminal domain-containing protein [Arthrobacter sp.]MDO5753015.1 LssY C-terminal domain-containing protein [Arthrobacter sp.]